MLTKKKRIYMWHRVKDLKREGLNKSQIARELELDRSTVCKYLAMSEDEFYKQIEQGRNLPKKLSGYLAYVKAELREKPYLSSAQIEDRLKEHYADLPQVHSRTVYNFVQYVRGQYGIAKPKGAWQRDFEQLPPTAYGKQAQVDFGECYMQTQDKRRVKVYFFTMVLSRSRYKYVYFQEYPFTTKDTVYAHQLTFEYFQGIPRDIIYDQDKLFIHNENLGDYLLTHDFKAFSQSQPFEVVFCRKADPQSKGKVENVVKYIKNNLLRGRAFISVSILNQESLSWLSRTGNAKVHQATQKVPAQEWEIEKAYLHPVRDKAIKPKSDFMPYNVRKDNTIAWRGNFYTLPLGTYQGRKTSILLSQTESHLNLYAMNEILLATHQISSSKGELVRNRDHAREKSKSYQQKHQQVHHLLGFDERAALYLDLLQKKKPRYYHDNLRAIIKGMQDITQEFVRQGLDFCLENEVYNGADFCQVAMKYQNAVQRQSMLENSRAIFDGSETRDNIPNHNVDMNLQISNITTYENLIESWNK